MTIAAPRRRLAPQFAAMQEDNADAVAVTPQSYHHNRTHDTLIAHRLLNSRYSLMFAISHRRHRARFCRAISAPQAASPIATIRHVTGSQFSDSAYHRLTAAISKL
jgi:hypothetical protein